MVCRCEKCRRDFFPENIEDSNIVCPECGGEVAVWRVWPELHHLVDLLAKGQIRGGT